MYSIVFLFTVFIGLIDFRIPYASYWDELIVLLIVLMWVILIFYKSELVPRYLFINVGLILFLVVIGVLGNVLHPGLQENPIAILKDILAFAKFPLAMLLLPQIMEGKTNDKHMLAKLARVIVLVTVFFAVVGYVVDIGVYVYDSSRILKTFEFFYQHCTFFASAYVVVMVVLMMDSIKKNRLFIILNCFLLLMTQRTKALFVVAVVIVIMLLGERRICKFFNIVRDKVKFNKQYLVLGLCVILIAGYFIGKDKATYYWQYGLSAARPALYMVGAQLMTDFFPIGSGFGTFASFISGESYSNVYYMYNLSYVNGLRPDSYDYISDVFWPYIYGQLGIVGLIGYVVFIFNIFRRQMYKLKDYNCLMAFLVFWIYAIFASTAEAFFTNTTAVQMALALCILIGAGKEECSLERE